MMVSKLSISPAACSVGQYARASANTLFAAASRPVRMSPQPMKSPDSAMGEHSYLWRSGSVSPLAQCDGRGDRVGTPRWWNPGSLPPCVSAESRRTAADLIRQTLGASKAPGRLVRVGPTGAGRTVRSDRKLSADQPTDDDAGQRSRARDRHRLDGRPPDVHVADHAARDAEERHEGAGHDERHDPRRPDVKQRERDDRHARREQVGDEHPERVVPERAAGPADDADLERDDVVEERLRVSREGPRDERDFLVAEPGCEQPTRHPVAVRVGVERDPCLLYTSDAADDLTRV